MQPVFLSPVVTLIRCGADRATKAVFRRQAGRLRCESHETVVFPRGTSGGNEWLENSCAAIHTLRHDGREQVSAVLVLPPQATLLKHLRTPRVEVRKRERIVAFAAGQNIPCALNEVVWDSVLSGEVESAQDVLLVAAKLGVVEPLCAAAQASGFALQRIVPSALAMLAAGRMARPGRNEPELWLTCEAGAVTLLQLSDGRFAARTLLLGGEEGGSAAAWVDRVAPEVTRSVLHFQRQCGLPEPVRLLLAGEGAPQPNLGLALAQRLKLPVQGLDVGGIVGLAPTVKAPDSPWTLCALAGAAAMELGEVRTTVNLLPLRLRTQLRRRRRRPALVAAALLVLAAPVGPMMHFHRLAQAAEAKLAEVEAGLVPLRGCDARNRGNLARLAELEQQINAWQGVLDRRTAWLQLMADLQERLGGVEDVWLERLRIGSGSREGPLKLVVTGRLLERVASEAMSVPESLTRVRRLLASLKESPFVAAVESERFDGSQPGLLAFELVLVTETSRPL